MFNASPTRDAFNSPSVPVNASPEATPRFHIDRTPSPPARLGNFSSQDLQTPRQESLNLGRVNKQSMAALFFGPIKNKFPSENFFQKMVEVLDLLHGAKPKGVALGGSGALALRQLQSNPADFDAIRVPRDLDLYIQNGYKEEVGFLLKQAGLKPVGTWGITSSRLEFMDKSTEFAVDVFITNPSAQQNTAFKIIDFEDHIEAAPLCNILSLSAMQNALKLKSSLNEKNLNTIKDDEQNLIALQKLPQVLGMTKFEKVVNVPPPRLPSHPNPTQTSPQSNAAPQPSLRPRAARRLHF